MSRRGNCWDNAVAESFFGSLKKERIKKRVYADRESARIDVADYIENFYNQVRRHSHLGGVSPNEFESAHRTRRSHVHYSDTILDVIMLSPHVDALFDQGLMSFEDNGRELFRNSAESKRRSVRFRPAREPKVAPGASGGDWRLSPLETCSRRVRQDLN
jgi:hypothetical protein